MRRSNAKHTLKSPKQQRVVLCIQIQTPSCGYHVSQLTAHPRGQIEQASHAPVEKFASLTLLRVSVAGALIGGGRCE